MKKLFTILAVFFLVMGSNFIFAQESEDSSIENKAVISQTEISIQEDFSEPRFTAGKNPKVAKKVGEGKIEKDVEIGSSDKFDDKDESIRSSFRAGLRKDFPMEENPFEKYNKSVGVFGYSQPGLSWQHWLGKFGYQINFSGMYLPSEYYDYNSGTEENIIYNYTYALYMLTAEAQFEFFTTRFLKNWYGRLYGVLVGGFYYKTDYNVPEIFNGIAGFGLGFETIYYKHFSFPLHFGYYAEFPNEFKMDFMGGIGLRFRF